MEHSPQWKTWKVEPGGHARKSLALIATIATEACPEPVEGSLPRHQKRSWKCRRAPAHAEVRSPVERRFKNAGVAAASTASLLWERLQPRSELVIALARRFLSARPLR